MAISRHIIWRFTPHVLDEQRLAPGDLGFSDDGITHLHVSFGFQDETNVPAVLALAAARNLIDASDLHEVTYFLSRITVARSTRPTMPGWQKRLFLTIAHNSANPVEYFGLPISQTISMGAEILL